MGKNSNVDWTDHTWNPWQGCHKVSPGCLNCYMYRDKKRYGQDPSTVVRSKPATFNKPYKWKDPALVFVCSWSDFLIEEADEWRDDAWEVIRSNQHLTFQILTKRIESAKDCLPDDWPLPNVWLGVTAENQEQADIRIPILLDIPAVIRFISVEPMLNQVDLMLDLRNDLGRWGSTGKKLPLKRIDWVVCGAESGPGARPMDKEWAWHLKNQCVENNVSFFFKQMKVGEKLVQMPQLGGKIWAQMPTLKTT